jgi:HAE1 family hydrophobic/amphiphilic exporter-1
MQMLGLTINLITLFALVLAIGIVVDDAIVVVEAVHAKMQEENLSSFAAVKKVLGEISGAVIAITLIMTAVFVPIAFMTGPVGVFYRQFSITMASSIILIWDCGAYVNTCALRDDSKKSSWQKEANSRAGFY